MDRQKAPVSILGEVDALYELICCVSDIRGGDPSETCIHMQDLAPSQRLRQCIELQIPQISANSVTFV